MSSPLGLVSLLRLRSRCCRRCFCSLLLLLLLLLCCWLRYTPATFCAPCFNCCCCCCWAPCSTFLFRSLALLMPCLQHTHTCAGVRKRAHTDTLCRYLVVCVSVALSACITQCVCVCVLYVCCGFFGLLLLVLLAALPLLLLLQFADKQFLSFFFFFYNIYSPYFLAFCSFIVVVVDAVSGVAWLIKLCAQVHFRVCEPTTFYYFVSCFLLYSSIRFVSRVVVASQCCCCCCYFIAILHLTFAAFRCMQRTHTH